VVSRQLSEVRGELELTLPAVSSYRLPTTDNWRRTTTRHWQL